MASSINNIGFNTSFRNGGLAGLESDAALTHTHDVDQLDSDASLDSEETASGPKPEIELRPSPYKAFHIFEIDGKQYLLTEFDHNGTDTKFIGHLPEDWEEKAKAAKEVFDERKKADPKDEVLAWAHQLGGKTDKVLTSEGVKTFDPNPKIEEIFKRVNQNGHRFTIMKNPPKPVLACQKKPEKPVKPPIGPLNQPEPPPPGRWEKFKTWVSKFPFFGKKDS